jgi:cation diffusion facilitator family transporter
MTEYSRIQRVLLVILALNILVAAAKAVFGLLAGSMSMVADALHSSFDSASNIIGLIATRVAGRPPDRDHQYGHAKVESLATLIVGGMLLLTAYWVISEGIVRLTAGGAPEIAGITVGVMVATLAINIFVAWYERRMGEELQSSFLIADSEHTKSDVYVSLSVLGGFVAISAGYPAADPLIALAIGALIGKMGLSIIREAGMVLTDADTVRCEDIVRKSIPSIPGVRGYHRFRCRGGAGDLFADIHVTVDPEMSVIHAHEIAREVEAVLKERVPGMKEVIVHIEPGTESGSEIRG